VEEVKPGLKAEELDAVKHYNLKIGILGIRNLPSSAKDSAIEIRVAKPISNANDSKDDHTIVPQIVENEKVAGQNINFYATHIIKEIELHPTKMANIRVYN